MKTPLISQTEIIVEDDPKGFKTLFDKKIEFPNLEELIVAGCSGLKFLFSSSMVKSLMQLQNLAVCHCELMEEVIDTKGLEGEATFSFPKLLDLELGDLPKFTRFGIGNLVEFPSMNTLAIVNCPNLRTFFSHFTCEITSNNLEEMNSEQQNIQSLFTEKVGLPSLDLLGIYEMDNLTKIWDDRLCLDSFCKLSMLLLISNNKLLNIFPSSMLGKLHTLDTLVVEDCDSLKEIFEFQALNDQKSPDIIAPQLKELDFDGLPKLEHVWNLNANQILAFENLIEIRVSRCSGLKSLFPGSIAKRLLELEVLKIIRCDMNEVIAKEERVVEEATIPRFKFPRLSSLEISNLPFLESFYSKEYISEWPALKKMEVRHCSNIKILSSDLQKLDHRQPLFSVDKMAFPKLEELEVSSMDALLHLWVGNPQPSGLFRNLERLKVSECQSLKNLEPSTVSLWNLQNLEVSECDKLTNLVTFSTARSLGNVKSMDIADCRMIKEIITQEGDEAINDDDQIVFNQLNYLRLHALPSLTSFCSQSYAIEFKTLFGKKVSVPNLEKLEVYKVDTLRKIWDDQLTLNSICKLKDLRIEECCELEEILELHALGGRDEIVFSELKYLSLICLARLKGFYLGNCTLKFPSLDDVLLGKCSKMEIFSQGIVNSPKLQRVKLAKREDEEENEGAYEWCWEGDLNTTSQQILKKMNAQTSEQD